MPPIYDPDGSNHSGNTPLSLPESQRPYVLFRVINKSGPERGPGAPNGGFDWKGNLRPRWPLETATVSLESFDDHMSWKHVPTPYISFFSDWNTAMRRISWIFSKGGRRISIIAIWGRDLEHLYNAHAIARKLGYVGGDYHMRDENWKRRKLVHHRYEYLHHGRLMRQDSLFLATFSSRKEFGTICSLATDMWQGSFDCAGFSTMKQLFDQYSSLSPIINLGKLWALMTIQKRSEWTINQHPNGEISVLGLGREWTFRDVASLDPVWESEDEEILDSTLDHIPPSTRYSASDSNATRLSSSEEMYNHLRTLFFHGGRES
ncbi:hypothetical protein F5X99DRAFT_415039 [Biscogniauxia marginata]|nr:hypothetical protein F5X99DRAFT_415039 [Biscogniauxia marginata]